MIDYIQTRLTNGLTLIVHKDSSTPMAVINLLYKAGAKNELENKTGYAHLLEHLMFCGSKNAPNFDYIVQKAGGSNNAFTTNDYTNYYISLPAVNIETALWLESDRMTNALINDESVEVQKKVVIEEFREGYLNQPYGDIWHLINDLAYTVHPYRWPTIGLSVDHIEVATAEDLRSFYSSNYHPHNAVLSIGSPLESDEVIKLAEKWFGSIQPENPFQTTELPQEPHQKTSRSLKVERDVSADMLIKSFAMDKRTSLEYYACDLLTDVLAQGNSSRLYQKLVKEKKIFSQIDAYVTGSLDPGQILIEGRISENIDLDTAEKALDEEIETLCSHAVSNHEIEKANNQKMTTLAFNYQNLFEKTFNLAFYEMLGNTALINNESDIYKSIDSEKLLKTAQKVFSKERSCTLYYKMSEQ